MYFFLRRFWTATGVLAAAFVTATLFLIWRWPPAMSAVRSLNTPSGQPELRIPNDTKSIEKALVIPKTRHDDVRWTDGIRGGNDAFTAFVYTTDVWSEPQYLVPRTLAGREASAYLSYILDYYDALPKYSFFIHAAEDQWHNDVYSKATNQPDSLRSLRTAAIETHGYVNLRCKLHPGCPPDIAPTALEGVEMPKSNPRVDFAEIYTQVMDGNKSDVPEHIGNVCCAQFGVSRERVLQRPKEDYERMLSWAHSQKDLDGFGVGFVFEKLWHIIFGMDAVHCPRFEQCRCDAYGWCGPLETGEVLVPAAPK